ncbi:MAG: helix-hairpin-helix domain-containing protein [Anaerolineales bacterium]|nr:helix-hairpin-helix domain-containing protein [Anaerolineales bacterium]
MIIDTKEWQLINQETRMNKGKLVNIDLGKGRFVKMYEADAIAQGLLKAKPQAPNKMRVPGQNKAAPVEKTEAQPEEKPPADDFTTIAGVGPATARALVSHGITTFEQLKAESGLDYLTTKTMQAIEDWRNG